MDHRKLRFLIDCCEDCPLKVGESKYGITFGEGDTDVMVVGDISTDAEDHLLRDMMTRAGISSYYLTDVVKHTGKVTKNEIIACNSFLGAEIKMVNPSHIILLGSDAAKLVTGGNPAIRKIVGMTGELNDRKYVVIYHPSDLLKAKKRDFKYASMESQVLTTLAGLYDNMPKYDIEEIICKKNHRI